MCIQGRKIHSRTILPWNNNDTNLRCTRRLCIPDYNQIRNLITFLLPNGTVAKLAKYAKKVLALLHSTCRSRCTQTAYMASLFYTKSSLHLLHCTKRFRAAKMKLIDLHSLGTFCSVCALLRSLWVCRHAKATLARARWRKKEKLIRREEAFAFLNDYSVKLKRITRRRKENYFCLDPSWEYMGYRFRSCAGMSAAETVKTLTQAYVVALWSLVLWAP